MRNTALTIPLLILSCAGTLLAQEPADALRYSWLTPSGTARNQAIGGANASLGGDLSSMFGNPAGIALYRTGEFVFTPGFQSRNNSAAYLGSSSAQRNGKLNLGATGFILPMGGSGRGKWRNVTIGIGWNRTADFNGNTYLKGRNSKSSFSEKYLEELINNNVTDPNDAAQEFPYGSSLAFNTYLVDTLSGPGGTVRGYRSLATPQTGVNQEQSLLTKGSLNEYALSLGANMGDKLYIGGSLLWNTLNFERNASFKESDATTNTRNNFNYFTVDEYLSTVGVGVGLKLGVIFKPAEQIRLGLSVHTPTYYNMEDRYATTVTTDLEGYGGAGTKTQSSREFNNGSDGEFGYAFSNPLRILGGVSYVFREDADITRQKGFISADVEYVNYAGASFSSSDGSNSSAAYFNELNQTIDGYHASAINLRLGGELKFSTFMVRAGVSHLGNPYATAEVTGGLTSVSGGIGYRDKGRFIDLAYVHRMSKDGYFPYRLDNGFFAPAEVRSTIGTVLLTVGMKF